MRADLPLQDDGDQAVAQTVRAADERVGRALAFINTTELTARRDHPAAWSRRSAKADEGHQKASPTDRSRRRHWSTRWNGNAGVFQEMIRRLIDAAIAKTPLAVRPLYEQVGPVSRHRFKDPLGTRRLDLISGASTTVVVFRDGLTFFTVVQTIAGPRIVAND
jgi:hypothetical protein